MAMASELQPVILQVLPKLNTGGVERGTIEMAIAIQKAGGRPVVASQGGRLVVQLQRLGILHVTLPLARKTPFAIWRNKRALIKLIRKEGVSLVHARSRAPSWAAWRAARYCRVPFVTTWHGVHENRFFLKRRYNSVLTRGDRVIAISHYIADRIVRDFTIGNDRLRTINRGVDTDRFDPTQYIGQRVQNLASRFDLPPDAKIIMMPGRLTRWKGQLLLIEALARLDHSLKWHCVFVGPTDTKKSYLREMEDRVLSLGLKDRIRFIGQQDDMPAIYAMADVVVAASLKPEPFGRVIIEAQAMGCPVIVSAQGGAMETVLHEETGLIIPPNDRDALARAIDMLLNLDDESRAFVRQRARQHMLDNYTITQMQFDTLAVYDELLDSELAAMFQEDLLKPEKSWPPNGRRAADHQFKPMTTVS